MEYGRRTHPLILAGCFLVQINAVVAAGLPTREEVLDAVYPGADFEAQRIFLTDEEMARVERSAGSAMTSPLVAVYFLFRAEREVGRAYVDTHRVRTKKQSLLICLDEEGKIRRVETTAFLEPPEYQLSQAWFRQYRAARLHEDLRLGRGIRMIAGATLTCRAAADAIRRALALDRVLRERGR